MSLVWPAKLAEYRTEARARDLGDVIDEQLVIEAEHALALKGKLLSAINLDQNEVLVTYVLRAGPDGRPTTNNEPPTVRVRRRKLGD